MTPRLCIKRAFLLEWEPAKIPEHEKTRSDFLGS